MSNLSWSASFKELFERCVKLHRAGQQDPSAWYSSADTAFLQSIGHTGQEFFDFVDDHCRYPDGPTLEIALLVAAVRRDYLHVVQHGRTSTKTVPPSALPPKPAQMDGIPWLPRIIAKARAKLRGEMDPDTMYGCGGDRAFFQEHDLDPAQFLRVVWAAGDDDQKILSYVKNRGKWPE